ESKAHAACPTRRSSDLNQLLHERRRLGEMLDDLKAEHEVEVRVRAILHEVFHYGFDALLRQHVADVERDAPREPVEPMKHLGLRSEEHTSELQSPCNLV